MLKRVPLSKLFLFAVCLITAVTLIVRASRPMPANEASVPALAPQGDTLMKYQYLSSLPLEDRKKFFIKASAKDKSDLWKTHLALNLAKRNDLNDEQKRVILDAIALATPEFFSIRQTDSARADKVDVPIQSLKERAITAFTATEGASIFASLGGAAASSFESLLPTAKSLLLPPACDCNRADPWCGGSRCFWTVCEGDSWGCGTLWMNPCNGQC